MEIEARRIIITIMVNIYVIAVIMTLLQNFILLNTSSAETMPFSHHGSEQDSFQFLTSHSRQRNLLSK